tara:strand:- start:4368 stop:5528 length:1161 start_codon:yes stop_codon:yes gene_type:complete
MKKILIIHNKYRNIGGEDTSVANEVNFLKDYYEIEILYFENNITNFISQFFYFIKGSNNKSKKIISKKIDEFKPDLVYVHNTWFKASVSIFDELKKRKIQTIVKIHNFRYYCSRNFLQINHIRNKESCAACGMKFKKTKILNKYFEDSLIKSLFLTIYSKKLIKKLNYENVKVVVLTDFHKQFIQSLNIIKNEINIVPNFLQTFEKPKKQNSELEENYIIYAGRISKEKGLAELVDAYKKSDLNGITLKIYGEGPLNLNYFVNEGDKKIEIFDVVSNDEIKKIISNSLAVITTTKLYEGQPTLLCEASAANIVSIFPRTGGIEEFFPPNNKFSYEQFNYDDLIKKLELLNNLKLVNQQADLNNAFIKEKLSKERVLKTLEKVFENG